MTERRGPAPRGSARWPERLWRDVMVGARLWRRRPGAPVVAVLSLGIAIGVALAVFELSATLYWRTPFATEATALFRVAESRDGEALAAGSFPLEAWRGIRGASATIADLAAERVEWVWSADLDGRGAAAELDGGVVSANYFDVLGLRPSLGRLFVEGEDDASGAAEVVVLGHRLWRQRFRADPAVLGRSVLLNGRRFTVIGVAPAGFSGTAAGDSRDLWLAATPGTTSGAGTFALVGRYRGDSTIARASDELHSLAAPWLELASDEADRVALSVEPMRGAAIARREDLGRSPRLAALAAVCVWLLACLNVAGLLSVRHAERRRELVMRLALGGSGRALTAQLAVEALALAVGGGALGLVVALGAGGLLQRWYGYRLPGLELELGWGAVGLAGLLALAACVVAGLPPAWVASRAAVAAVGSSVGGAQRPRSRFAPGTALVVAQVALSLALVAAAAVMARSVEDLLGSDGAHPAEVRHYRLRPSRIGYDAAAATRYRARLLQSAAAVPGVRSVALARVGPDRGWCCPIAVAVPERRAERAEDELRVDHNHVSTDYLRTLGIPVLRGRDFAIGDAPGAPPVAIVNRALAERLWSAADPIGRQLVAGGREYQVVGVVPDLLPPRPGEAPVPYLLLALEQHELVDVRLYARLDGDPAIAHALRKALVEADPAVHVGQEGTLRERTLLQHADERTLAGVLRVCAILALALAALGLYAQLAQAVSRRTREMGLRLALGAHARRVTGMVVAQGMAMVLAGVVLGLFAAAVQGRLLAAYLHGVSAREPRLLFAAVLIVVGIGAAAAYLPARRVSRIDPWRVLRHE